MADLNPPGHDGWVVLDEVQRTPLVLNEVHRQIEGAGRRFILTGSSARSLRRRGVNLLGGRARTYRLYRLPYGALLDVDFLPAACEMPSTINGSSAGNATLRPTCSTPSIA